MKNRKILSVLLVLAMVFSMSTFVFATEEEIQPRSCTHEFVVKDYYTYWYGNATTCCYYIDSYEQCRLCGYIAYTHRSDIQTTSHLVENGDSYCWQCHHYGCQ